VYRTREPHVSSSSCDMHASSSSYDMHVFSSAYVIYIQGINGAMDELNGCIERENRKYDGHFLGCRSQAHTPTIYQKVLSVCVCVCACVYLCTCVCVCVCIYKRFTVYVRTHTHTHTHTHFLGCRRRTTRPSPRVPKGLLHVFFWDRLYYISLGGWRRLDSLPDNTTCWLYVCMVCVYACMCVCVCVYVSYVCM
jgi:hypothetical protein